LPLFVKPFYSGYDMLWLLNLLNFFEIIELFRDLKLCDTWIGVI